MCYERQSAESTGLYYVYDKETDKVYSRPVYESADESGGDRRCRCCASNVQLVTSLVWPSSCVHQACSQVRCAATVPDLTCCTTTGPKSKWGVKRGTFNDKCSFMQMVSNQEERFGRALVSSPNQSVVLSPQPNRVGLLSTEQLIHNQISREFCRSATNCESPASDCQHNSPSSSSESNSPLSHNNQTTVYSPCSHQHQQPYPLTPASTSSETSPNCCQASSGACSPLFFSGLYSPESPNYWLVQSSCLVPEEIDWRQWLDEIIEDVRGEIRSETIFDQSHKNELKSQRSLKRKSSCTSSSDIDNASSVDVPPLSKRAKKYSLAALTHEQVAQRKKEQNRIAAQRYRMRKTQTLEGGRSEIGYLEKRNADLRMDIYGLEQEIKNLKQLLVSGPENVDLEQLEHLTSMIQGC